jgi:hypothetical protein
MQKRPKLHGSSSGSEEEGGESDSSSDEGSMQEDDHEEASEDFLQLKNRSKKRPGPPLISKPSYRGLIEDEEMQEGESDQDLDGYGDEDGLSGYGEEYGEEYPDEEDDKEYMLRVAIQQLESGEFQMPDYKRSH